MILELLAFYLLGCLIGAVIFYAIGSHICTRDKEFYEFVAECDEAHERGEL